MNNYIITGQETLEAYDYLLEQGFEEKENRVVNVEEVDENPLMLFIDKELKIFYQVDNDFLNNFDNKTQKSDLKEIKQWRN